MLTADGVRSAGQLVVAQIADGQLPGAVGQDDLAQAHKRGPVKPHVRILRAARRRCNSLTGPRPPPVDPRSWTGQG